ncbi:MAG: hypothetical protein ACF8QF_07840 [Phycisphaerales bacterium]
MSERSDEPIYVGYLPAPARHGRLVRIAVPAIALLALAVGVGAALSQRDPGPGVWSDGSAESFRGVLVERPYPMLVPADGPPLLLVEMSKRGAQGRVAGLDGQSVEATGWPLTREGRRMLELSPEPDALRELETPVRAAVVEMLSQGSATLVGEIVDSKCYLGAMKPGDGKGHKACATLCVTGGIPPVLVTFDKDGAAVGFYLIADEAGDGANAIAAPFLGEPVEVSGTLASYAGMQVLRVRADGISVRSSAKREPAAPGTVAADSPRRVNQGVR